MSGNGILEISLGVAVLLGAFIKGRNRRFADIVIFVPDILIGIFLILQAITMNYQHPHLDAIKQLHPGLLILLFLPYACCLENNIDRVKKCRLLCNSWLVAAMILSALHLLFSDRPNLSNIQGLAIEFIGSIFLVAGLIRFHAFQRLLCSLGALIWVLHHAHASQVYISGCSLVMGSLVFFRAGFLSRAQMFKDFHFESEDLIDAFKNPFLILNLSGRAVFAKDEFQIISGYDKRELLNKEAIDIFEMPSNWKLRFGPSRDSRRIRCYLIRHDGEKHPVFMTISEVCRKSKAVKNLMCTINDEQEYERMEARIKAEARRFSGLYDTSVALSASLEMKDVLEAIATAAETLTDSDTCSIFALDHARQVIKPIYSTEEVFGDEVMNFEFSVGQGLTGAVIRDGKPHIQNWDDDTAIAVLIPGTTDEDESLLSVPLLAKNVVIGALTLYKISKKKFYEEQILTLTVFASQASSAIETSRLYMKLKESEKVYRSSVDMAGDSIFFVDSETGKITDANETGIRAFKYLRSELVAKYIWELHPQPQMPLARQLWQSAVTDGRGTLGEIDYETKDGALMPASINASKIATGDINFIQWIVRDISEYKNTIRKVGFSHKILSGLAQPMLITDIAGITCFFNTSFKSFFALEDGLAENTSIKSLTIRNPKLAILESVWNGLKDKSSFTRDLVFNPGQNNQITLTVSVLPYHDECDNLTHYIWIFLPSARPEDVDKKMPEASQTLPRTQ